MICLDTGLTGAGKSVAGTDTVLSLLVRNDEWFHRTGKVRMVYTNDPLNPELMKEWEGRIAEWKDPLELCELRHCDIYWNEVSTHLDATEWPNVPMKIKIFLRQHRKRGIELYGNCQDFSDVYVGFRRLVTHLYYLEKWFGSDDISETKPPLYPMTFMNLLSRKKRVVWGLIKIKEVERSSFSKKEVVDYEFKPFSLKLLAITWELTHSFDTTREVAVGKFPPLEHEERSCEKCGYVKVIHH